jgi:glycosyltransferase involved in cell wall biosynthesis
VHRALQTYTRRIDGYVALTSFQRDLMVHGGLPAERIRIVPNFLEPDPGMGHGPRSGMLFVGRLSVEKGVEPLVTAGLLAPGLVRIAGDGPDAERVVASAQANHVEFLGRLEPPRVLHELRSAIAMVMPSICFEGFPMAIVEAYATGTPVIASRIGSLAEVVEDGVTGLLAEPGDPGSLAERLRWANDHPHEMREMGMRARERYETQFRGRTHLAALLDAYDDVKAKRALIHA